MSEMNKSYNTEEVMKVFAAANLKYKQAIELFVKRYGMQRSQHRLLMTMTSMNNGGPVSQRDVAQEMKVTPAAIAVNLKKLAAFGMVEKVMSEKDNRFNDVVFTKKGLDTVKESKDQFKAFDDIALNGFSNEEKAVLIGFLQRMSANMDRFDV